MFLIGIWHGAGLNFIIYGIIHGSYVGIDTYITGKFPSIRKNSFLKSKFGKIITILSTPCSAPFIGTALGFAFVSPNQIIFLIFFCISLGLSSPYIICLLYTSPSPRDS